MAVSAPAKTPRNELILANAHLPADEIRKLVWRELKIEISTNGVNGILHRGKATGDRRAKKRDRRWARGKGFNPSIVPERRRKKKEPEVLEPLPPDVPLEDLPATARQFINPSNIRSSASNKECKFPLRGSRLGLIVCGAPTLGKPPYCPKCRALAYLPEEQEAQQAAQIPAPAVIRPTPDAERHMTDQAPRAETRDDPAVLPSDHFYAGLKRNAYGLIYSDPDVLFATRSDKGQGRSPSRHYSCRPIEEIAKDPVADLAAPDCLLALWVPGPFIVRGDHRVLFDAWGFKPSAMGLVWIKTNDPRTVRYAETWEEALHWGLGFTSMQNAEFCLFARRGAPKRMARDVKQVIVSPVLEHSRKPKEARRRLERYVGLHLPPTDTWKPPLAVELHARESTPGWDTWGWEKTKFDPVEEGQEAA